MGSKAVDKDIDKDVEDVIANSPPLNPNIDLVSILQRLADLEDRVKILENEKS